VVRQARDRDEQDAFVQSIGQDDAIGIDAEERGRFEDRVAKVRVGREGRTIESPNRLHNLRGTTASVFVEMEAKART
jgi:hypothetical protein